jgi:hypothetical protein
VAVICAAQGCRKHAVPQRQRVQPEHDFWSEFCALHGVRVLIFCNWMEKGLPNGRSFDGDRAHLEPFPWSPV